MKRHGGPEKIDSIHFALLRELALAQPMSTVDALLGRFRLKTGISVSKVTLSKALKGAGIRRFKPTEPPSATTKSTEDSQEPKRYGYQARHRPTVSKERTWERGHVF